MYITYKKGTEKYEGHEVGVGESASAVLVGWLGVWVRRLGALGRFQARQHYVGPRLTRGASTHTSESQRLPFHFW